MQPSKSGHMANEARGEAGAHHSCIAAVGAGGRGTQLSLALAL